MTKGNTYHTRTQNVAYTGSIQYAYKILVGKAEEQEIFICP
jgi:hypothetical protein